MSGWYFVLGFFAGSLMAVATMRALFSEMKWPTLRPKFTTLRIVGTGSRKIHAIKEIRAVTGLGLREAKDATEGAPLTLDRAAASDLADRLRILDVEFTTTPVRKSA